MYEIIWSATARSNKVKYASCTDAPMKLMAIIEDAITCRPNSEKVISRTRRS